MRSAVARALFFVCFSLLSAICSAADYTAFTDEFGNLYLKAPDKFVVLPEKPAVPVQVLAERAYIRLVLENGQWRVEFIDSAAWRALSLKPATDGINVVKFADFDGDGDKELFISLAGAVETQLLISKLDTEPEISVSYFEPQELVGVAQNTPVYSTFATIASPTINSLTPGEFRVDESGAANYSIALSLPDGIAGVVPQLGFSYNSSAGDGYMGRGWSFSGASVIARCPQNLSVDNLQGNVSFSASDRLCIDGQRLVKNGAVNDKGNSDTVYWAASSEYHTELDSFSLVKAHGTSGQGPKAFTVETKSGEIHYYGDITAVTGNDTMSKPLALTAKSYGNITETGADAFFDTASGSNIARLWALKAIKDVKGNYIVFKYTEDHALGEHYLSEVHYTGRSGGAAPFARVVLTYVDNTKIAVGWQAAQRVAMTKLLDTVNVEIDGSIYRQYRLNYFNTNVLEEKNYLLSIQECADTGSSNCLPPTTFDWNRPAAVSTTYVQRCDNEPGVPQYCWQEPVTDNYAPFSTSYVTKGSSIDRYYQQLIDMNGDGFVDLVYPSGGTWRVRFGGTTSNWTESCVTPPGEPTQCFLQPAVSNFATEVSLTSVGVAKKQYAQTIDYDGDGQRDLLVANSTTSNWSIVSYKQSTSTVQQCEPFPDNHICYPHEVTSAYTLVDVGYKATGLEGGAIVADYDGDGLEDIVFVSGGVFQAYRNKGVNAANTHMGFEHKTNIGSISGSSTQFSLDVASYTADSKSASAFDVNGDGRTDILIKVAEGVCRLQNGTIVEYVYEQECRSEGWSWSEETSWKLYTTNGVNYSLAQDVGNYFTVRAVDLNGDGYSDLMYQSGTAWYYRLSNGAYFQTTRSANLTSATNLLGYTYFLDINGDGRTDMLLPTSTNSWKVMLSRPTKTHEQVIFEQRGTRTFDSGAAIQFADINADGKLDLLTSTNDSGWKIYLSNRPYTNEHSIRKIINGMGAMSLIEYQSITDKTVYFRQDSTNNLGSDYISPRAGMYVVSKASSEVNTGKYVSVDYQYGGLLLHKKGRGMLGFEVLRTTDNQTGVLSETVYKQLWPYTGMPYITSQYKGSVLLNYAENTVTQQTSAYGGMQPVISATTERSYQFGSNSTQYPLAQTVSSFGYDNYGNLTTSTVTQSDINDATKKLVTSTTNVFNSTSVYQRYGRLTSSTVSKTLNGNAGTTISRQSAFSYNADLMLDTETLSPNTVATKVATKHLYDAAGNLTGKQVTAATTATGTSNVTRTSSTAYDSRYRYVASTTDVAGNTTSFTYNGLSASTVTGKISYIDAKDANNQTVRNYFDVIGRTYRSYVKGALAGDNEVNSYTYWELCSAVTCPSGVTGAYLQIRSEGEGLATKKQFLDKYGREVGASALLLDGTTSVTKTTYDDFGRPSRVYEPGSNAPSTSYSQANYDSLGRISSSNLASGGSSSITYAGLLTTTTDPQGKTRKTLNNYLGQTFQVQDHLNNTLEYTYDSYGNLKNVLATNVSGGSTTPTTNTYDIYGRKTQMIDKDKGTWNYTYNAFGELLTQTDANLQTTSMTYDAYGRLVRRYDASGTACWEFGTAAGSYNKGKLYRSSSYAGNQLCTTGNTPLYRETFSYNSRGLVANKLVNAAGNSFSISSTYDIDGRLDLLTYPSWSLNPATDDIVIKHGYQNGSLKTLTDNKTSTVYQDITAVNGRGQATSITFGNGVVETRNHFAQSGWLDTLSISKSGTTLHSLDYGYDNVGNVLSRAQGFGVGSQAGFNEVFTYDDLHRVKTRTISNLNNSSGYNALPAALKMNESYTYDHWGNITFKTNAGYYKYDTTKTNRLTQVWSGSGFTGTKHYDFNYDNNGNVLNDSQRSFTYTAFDKPSTVTQGSNYTDFAYGTDRQLYRRTDVRSGQTTDSFYIDGLYERVTLPSGVVEHKFNVGNTVITKRSNGAHDELYLHKDSQGSTISITKGNSDGTVTVLQQFIYDPWGKQYSVSNNSLFTTYSNPGTSKGYTGHNMVNDFEVIHMGGRTYNPHLGRFMQADPFVQAPGNLQNYNRYSYVLNNPMSYTDPSGYFFKWAAGKLLGKAGAQIAGFGIGGLAGAAFGAWAYDRTMNSQGLQTVASVALNFIPGCQVWCSALFSAQVNYHHTGSLKAAFHAGGQTAAIAGVFYGIGKAFNANSGFWETGGAAHIAAHAIAGGVISDLQGGKFGHGFWSAGITKAANVNGIVGTQQGVAWDAFRIAVSATIGGTVSKLTGGKFANGATTAAFAQAFNGNQQAKLAENFKITDDQRELAANGKRKAFWLSRKAVGDPMADIALAAIENEGGVGDYLFGGQAINNRLQAYARVYGGGELDLHEVGVEVMKAHVLAVDQDKIGVIGLLNPRQIAKYHHDVFANYGLPTTAFGGTPMTGGLWEASATRWVWCRGCD